MRYPDHTAIHPAWKSRLAAQAARVSSLWLFALLLATLPAQAQTPSDIPGYISLTELEQMMETPAALSVNIEGPLLKLVAESTRLDDPEFAELLLRLAAIQVRGFPMRDGQFGVMEERSMAIARSLEADGWNTVVHLRQAGQYVDMYVMNGESSDDIAGLMMLVVDQDRLETVIINIAGDIDPAELGRIGSKFNIAPLNDL